MYDWRFFLCGASLSALGVLFSINSAQAAQFLPVADCDSVSATVSSDELTRFSMADGGRISRIWGPDDRFIIEPDKDSGQVFMRLLDERKDPFSVFVKDDAGATYTVLIKPAAMPADSVVLQAQGGDGNGAANAPSLRDVQRYAPASNASGREYNWISTAKRLLRAMAMGTLSVDVPPEALDENLNTSLSGNLRLTERYQIEGFTAEVLTFTASADQYLDEREFGLADSQQAQAVAIEKNTLKNGDATHIYRVTGAGVW